MKTSFQLIKALTVQKAVSPLTYPIEKGPMALTYVLMMDIHQNVMELYTPSC